MAMLLTPGHSNRLSRRFAAAEAATVKSTPFFSTFLLIFIILTLQQQNVASESKYKPHFLCYKRKLRHECNTIANTLNFHINVYVHM